MSSHADQSDRAASPDYHTAQRAVDSLSAEPILAAIENYQGSITDLEDNLTVDAASLAVARGALLSKLQAGGLEAGDRIVIAVGNGPLFVAALDAVLRAGGSPLLVHYQLPATELRRIAIKYAAAQILTDANEADQLTALGCAAVPHDLGWRRCFQVTLSAADAQNLSLFPALPAMPLHPTSGSTGQAKMAVRPGPCAIAEATNYITAIGLDHRDSELVVTPMSHAYAYGMGLMAPLVSGARILSLRKFAAKAVLEAIKDRNVTVFPAVPAMLDVLLFGGGDKSLGRPRLVLSAGAPLTQKTVEKFEKLTGRSIAPLYGTTETGGITVGVCGVRPNQFQNVGPALCGVRAQLAPARSAELGEGVGRVMIQSPSMMAGYLGPHGIDRTPISDGWFVTGDLGRITREGEIELVGRESDVINVAAMKVVPSEVEEVVAEYPGVEECKAYAGTSITGAQFVKVAIVADPSFDEAKLRLYCSQQLVSYKRPVKIARLSAMPRNAAGKIITDQLP
jgi:acyl-CoA synthetase (AMP-forming)/AMP-acid ligase II